MLTNQSLIETIAMHIWQRGKPKEYTILGTFQNIINLPSSNKHNENGIFFCQVLRMGGIKLQVLCGVRIELDIGSLPYPGMIRIPGSVLDETGNYLDSQFVSPVWT